MKLTEGSAPNTLWSYWESDSSILPPIVETCHRSWSGVGSFASVHLLMPEDLPKYLSSNDLPSRFQEMPPVKRANAVRLALLSRHGGYWVDAGVLTTGPVDDWVKPKASSHGFFVFQDVDRSRILDTWFISGTPHSAFLREWRIRYQKFFDRRKIHEAHSLHKTPSKIATHIIVAINKRLRSAPSKIAAWAKFPLARLPMYPYFIMHYIANSLLETPELQSEFASMTKIKASRALAMRGLLDKNSLTRDAAKVIASDVPIHKLNTYRTYSSEELEILESLITTSKRKTI